MVILDRWLSNTEPGLQFCSFIYKKSCAILAQPFLLKSKRFLVIPAKKQHNRNNNDYDNPAVVLFVATIVARGFARILTTAVIVLK